MTPNENEKPKTPKCPHCDMQPCQTALQIISFGMGTMAAVFICAGCDKILSVAPLPVLPQGQSEKPLIVPGVN